MSLGIASSAYPMLAGCQTTTSVSREDMSVRIDPENLLDLPPGFSYSVHSRSGACGAS